MADPFAFTGRRKRNFFEGWYCKNVAATGEAYSFIPGISYAEGEAHGFVQVIRGADGQTAYVRYPASEFSASRRTFDVTVGPNRFRFDGAQISLPEAFDGIEGELRFSGVRRLGGGQPASGAWKNPPRIMGWYRFVPRMECYHEVGSLSHTVGGSLTVGGSPLSFDGGRGYLEKDWGSSMPSAWIWLQCNGFPTVDASVMLSVARIPWIGKSFTGFIGFLALPETIDPTPVRFGTYSGSRITRIDFDGSSIAIDIDLGSRRVHVDAERQHAGLLSAPVSGEMSRRISESIDGTVALRVTDRSGRLVWESGGSSAGVELVGIIDSLKP